MIQKDCPVDSFELSQLISDTLKLSNFDEAREKYEKVDFTNWYDIIWILLIFYFSRLFESRNAVFFLLVSDSLKFYQLFHQRHFQTGFQSVGGEIRFENLSMLRRCYCFPLFAQFDQNSNSTLPWDAQSYKFHAVQMLYNPLKVEVPKTSRGMWHDYLQATPWYKWQQLKYNALGQFWCSRVHRTRKLAIFWSIVKFSFFIIFFPHPKHQQQYSRTGIANARRLI